MVIKCYHIYHTYGSVMGYRATIFRNPCRGAHENDLRDPRSELCHPSHCHARGHRLPLGKAKRGLYWGVKQVVSGEVKGAGII